MAFTPKLNQRDKESQHDSAEGKTLAYFIRTPALKYEARVARFFGALSRRGVDCEVFAVVKEPFEFEYVAHEYTCKSDSLPWRPLKWFAKFVEVQIAGLFAYLSRYRHTDTLVFSNYEFLILGLLLRLFLRKKIIVDLHEHYFGHIFRHHWVSRFFFCRVFSGVIFANRMRAVDYLGDGAYSDAVTIARNQPAVAAGEVKFPNYVDSDVFSIAIVGNASPGRFVRESIRALDRPELAGRVELRSFGPHLNEPTSHVSLIEHGRFEHSEIDDLMTTVDASLVFYDPAHNGNFRLCEPNRFFQAYNLGKIIFCFRHESLEPYFDSGCCVIEPTRFSDDLREQVNVALAAKLNVLGEFGMQESGQRRLLTYEGSLENLERVIRV